MNRYFKIQDIPEEEITPLVSELLEIIHHQQEVIQGLKDEIAILKGEKARPKIKPSVLGQMEAGEKKVRKSPKKKAR